MKSLKNCYGTRDTATSWFTAFQTDLAQRGFSQSPSVPCLFARDDCVIVTCVDDCLTFCKNQKLIDDLIESLKDEFKLTDEGDLETFVGAHFKKHGHGALELTQPHLAQSIFEVLVLNEDSKLNNAPANVVLREDKDGKNKTQTWNYRSVIWMLTCLASTSRPDIAFAVHQCAIFSSCPMRSHEEAVKRIGRCLKRTSNKGLIFKCDATKGIDAHADADFTGNWFNFNNHELESALS